MVQLRRGHHVGGGEGDGLHVGNELQDATELANRGTAVH